MADEGVKLPPLARGSSCLPCRRRKIRCSGKRPICSQCERLKKNCVYQDTGSKTRTQVLEERILSLEETIERLETRPIRTSPVITLLPAQPPRFDGWNNELLMSQTEPVLHPPPSLDFVPSYSPKHGGDLLRDSSVPYVSFVPRTDIVDGLRKWDSSSSSLPAEVQDQLMKIFFAHRHQFNFEIYVPRLLEKLQLPPEDNEAIHPALLNAMLLAACSCCGPDLQPWAGVFLSRARSAMNDSLAFADRLVQFMWASVLLAWYYTRTGKLTHAYHSGSTTMRFAIACGLHNISNPEESMQQFSGLLHPPKDKIELFERVNLWWAVYQLDRGAAVGGGLPRSIADEQVTTVWPQSFNALDEPLSAWPKASINELFLHGHPAINVSADCLLSLRSKSMCILERALTTSAISHNHQPENAFWTTFASVNNALIQIQRTLPYPNTSPPFNTITGPSPQPSPQEHDGPYLNPTLFFVRASIKTAEIILYNIFAEEDQRWYDMSLKAALDMAQDTVKLRAEPGGDFTNVCLSPLWYAGSEVLVREMRRNEPAKTKDQATRLGIAQTGLDSLAQSLYTMATFHPVLIGYIRKIRALLDTEEPSLGKELVCLGNN